MVGYNPNTDNETSKMHHFLAGAGSGFGTRLICQPFDMIKIRFQLQIEPISKSCDSSKYRGVFQAVTNIITEEGYSALWKGHVPAQALSIVYGIVQFSSYELYTKKLWHSLDNGRRYEPFIHFLCGAFAGCTATVSGQPFDVIRTRLIAQSEPKTYNSLTHAFTNILECEGIRGLYRGLTPTLLQIAPYAGAQFGFYHICNKLWLKAFRNLQDLSVSSSPALFQTLTCGAISGLAAKTLVYPLDLIKKRLQVQGFESARRNFGAVRSYNGMFDCAVKILREEKALSLYKGLTPSLMKAAVTTALNFTFYEQIIKILSDQK